MMQPEMIRPLLGFALTLVFLLTYLAQSLLPSPSEKPHSYDLSRAYAHLQTLAAHPRPFGSRQNDVIRQFIINQATTSFNQFKPDWADIHVDTESRGAWKSYREPESGGTYVEGLANIIVRFNGTDDSLESSGQVILFCAHYDSAPLSHGGSDDGMGVSALLSLLTLFSQHQPTHTSILLFDNAEESGLLGGTLFLQHPWVQNKSVEFLNIEGGGVGGHPNLFRITNSSYQNVLRPLGKASAPHGSTTFSDAFSLGYIRSGTNFDVWTNPKEWPKNEQTDGQPKDGWKGGDLAFYMHRDKYHTLWDDVPNLYGRRSLDLLLDDVWAVAKPLVTSKVSSKGKKELYKETQEKYIYFDVLHRLWIMIPLHLFQILDISFLFLGPLTLILILRFSFRTRKSLLYSSMKSKWIKLWQGGRVVFAFILLGGFTTGILTLYLRVNPDIIFSQPISVVLSIIFFALLLRLTQSDESVFRFQATLQIYLLTWIVDVLNEVFLLYRGIAIFYIIPIIHAFTYLAVVVMLIEASVFDQPDDKSIINPNPSIQVEAAREETATNVRQSEDNNPEVDETTPLIQNSTTVTVKSRRGTERSNKWLRLTLLFSQFLLLVPIPAILSWSTAWSLLDALAPTIVEGGSPLGVYVTPIIFFLLPIFLLLPLLPLLLPSRHIVFLTLILSSVLTLANLVTFPFSITHRARVQFRHTIDLSQNSSTISLFGLDGYLSRIVEEIPFFESNPQILEWNKTSLPRLISVSRTTSIEEDLGIDHNVAEKWVDVHARMVGNSTSVVTVTWKGEKTKHCRLSTKMPVESFQVHDQGGVTTNFKLDSVNGEDTEAFLDVYTGESDREWVVDIKLSNERVTTKNVTGSVECFWSDWEGWKNSKLQEVLTFVPVWTSVWSPSEVSTVSKRWTV